MASLENPYQKTAAFMQSNYPNANLDLSNSDQALPFLKSLLSNINPTNLKISFLNRRGPETVYRLDSEIPIDQLNLIIQTAISSLAQQESTPFEFSCRIGGKSVMCLEVTKIQKISSLLLQTTQNRKDSQLSLRIPLNETKKADEANFLPPSIESCSNLAHFCRIVLPHCDAHTSITEHGNELELRTYLPQQLVSSILTLSDNPKLAAPILSKQRRMADMQTQGIVVKESEDFFSSQIGSKFKSKLKIGSQSPFKDLSQRNIYTITLPKQKSESRVENPIFKQMLNLAPPTHDEDFSNKLQLLRREIYQNPNLCHKTLQDPDSLIPFSQKVLEIVDSSKLVKVSCSQDNNDFMALKLTFSDPADNSMHLLFAAICEQLAKDPLPRKCSVAQIGVECQRQAPPKFFSQNILPRFFSFENSKPTFLYSYEVKVETDEPFVDLTNQVITEEANGTLPKSNILNRTIDFVYSILGFY